MEKPEFEIVLDQICRFLQPIYTAIVDENEFSKVWSASLDDWIERMVEFT